MEYSRERGGGDWIFIVRIAYAVTQFGPDCVPYAARHWKSMQGLYLTVATKFCKIWT